MKEAMLLREHIAMSTNSSLCAQDKENILHGITENEMLNKFAYLSNEGYEEMFGIGRRLKEAFPDLIHSLDNNSSGFVSASSHWVDDSAKAFVYGLTEGKPLTIKENDSITRVNKYYLSTQIYGVKLMSIS